MNFLKLADALRAAADALTESTAAPAAPQPAAPQPAAPQPAAPQPAAPQPAAPQPAAPQPAAPAASQPAVVPTAPATPQLAASASDIQSLYYQAAQTNPNAATIMATTIQKYSADGKLGNVPPAQLPALYAEIRTAFGM